MNSLASYKSASQKARVFSEGWIEEQFKCPSCNGALERMPNNTAACDFVCQHCSYGFELKSKLGPFGKLVVNGAYHSMLTSIRSGNSPHLILLSYTNEYRVKDLIAIPRQFLIEEIVIPRKPLGLNCRRAGWQGCNLNIGLLPTDGRVLCITDFTPKAPDEIRVAWGRCQFLEEIGYKTRGWLTVTMGLIQSLGKQQFTLNDLYTLEPVARQIFPNNSHVKEKLRQQLQRLRDQGWLSFEGKGSYLITSTGDEPKAD